VSAFTASLAVTLLGKRKARTAAVAAIHAHCLTLTAALDAGLLTLAATLDARLLAATAAAIGLLLRIIAALDLRRLSAAAMSLVSALVGSRRGRNG
jgi:hypothetical protein